MPNFKTWLSGWPAVLAVAILFVLGGFFGGLIKRISWLLAVVVGIVAVWHVFRKQG